MSIKPYAQQYQSVPAGGNPRQTEAWALTEAARRIKDAQREPVDTEAFLAAVRLNWRLWTIFQAELTSPDCTVPLDIRHNVLSLCNFVDKRSVAIIADPTPDKANILININRELASGLFTTPKEAVAGGQAAPPDPAAGTGRLDTKA